MSLCRWSDYKCDLYIYESERGIECHIAYRHVVDEPKPPAMPFDGDDKDWAKYWPLYHQYSAEYDSREKEPIGLTHAGESRTFGDWSDLLSFVTELKAIGYDVPDWVIESIKEEQAET